LTVPVRPSGSTIVHSPVSLLQVLAKPSELVWVTVPSSFLTSLETRPDGSTNVPTPVSGSKVPELP
jgi:hypothetical protein